MRERECRISWSFSVSKGTAGIGETVHWTTNNQEENVFSLKLSHRSVTYKTNETKQIEAVEGDGIEREDRERANDGVELEEEDVLQ